MKITKHFGIVKGNTVRTKDALMDYFSELQSFLGGEITQYTELLAEARDEATKRMIDEAKELGANAVINIRFSTSSILSEAAEVLAYGTAVYVEQE